VTKRSVLAWLGGILVLAAVLVPGALAGKPTFERITVDDTFVDDFLTEACGVPVTGHAQGHVILRTMAGGGSAPVQINTLRIQFTVTAGDNTYRFLDVGADHAQVKQDGTLVLMIIGQVPFEFAGVLKINTETEEVLHEPHENGEARLERACAVLTA
jgi:hypothetical protein